ncbi:hypothetical protein SK128_008769 [Halocaridina rubra]|uniref:Dipeptidase n=1 Tax=Halocaridina rubra TaxID=373956 RepID=A0AAN8ZVW2_HALRR
MKTNCSTYNVKKSHYSQHYFQDVVKEMNRLGMIVDISHVAAQTMRDVLNITRAPVIFSHSDVRGLQDIPRNIPDDVLLKLAENGGVAMVNFLPYFLTGGNATIQDVVAHINYIRNLAGVDHVGIGSDYEGITETPVGLEDVSKYPYLFAELLLDEKWTDADLQKLAGLNLIRAFQEVERALVSHMGRTACKILCLKFFPTQARDDLAAEIPYDDLIPAEDIADHLECVHPWP